LESICKQLRRMLDELRALRPPPGAGVQSCVGGSLRDSTIPHCRPRMGPFKAIQEFHPWLRDDFKPADDLVNLNVEEDAALRETIPQQDGPWPPPVFTHGDLSASNVLVEGDKITGIIDWETSGWYPQYWEYTSA